MMTLFESIQRCRKQGGFTLVELSIVLVILGLLVGGVLSGQSLVRAAELRSVTSQYNGFVTAMQTFKDKYFAFPGDMANATSFWGAADGSTGLTSACGPIASSDTKTCNGNGDSVIYYYGNTVEYYRFWQHLANAGLITGQYTGASTNAALWLWGSSSLNAPTGKIGSSLWFGGWTAYGTGYGTFNGPNGAGVYAANAFSIGKVSTTNNPIDPIFKPEDAWNIDMKMDDGKPATGNVVIRATAGLNTCTDTADSSNFAASYLLTNSALTCGLIFRGGPFSL